MNFVKRRLIPAAASLFFALLAALTLWPETRGESGGWGLLALLPLSVLAAGIPCLAAGKRPRLLRTAVALCLLWAASSALLFLGMAACGSLPQAEQPVILLVPGCFVGPDGPSAMLLGRCEKALELAAVHPDLPILLSGWQGPGENQTEASAMREIFLRAGVPPERLIVDETASNTAENLQAAAALMNRLEVQGTVLVVSDDYHLLRILLLAARQGMEASVAASSRSGPLSLVYWFREQPALARALLFGY